MAAPVTAVSNPRITAPATAEPAPAGARDRFLLPILLVLFFCSGISGLTYEVVWLRVLGQVFGVTVWAASTVLASFMAGLAIGGYLAGRFAGRLRRPLLWYGVAELLVGLTAVATPAAFALLQQFYVWLYPALPASMLALTAVRFLLSFSLLVVPTTLMGATLPLVAQSALVRERLLGRSLSVLYATNTLGALVGVVATGFFLIGGIGIAQTFRAGLVVNLAVGAVAAAVGWRLGRVAVDPPAASGKAPGRGSRAVVIVFGLSGLTSLAYEVVWFRVLAHYQQVTTYVFTVMLATFLLGIALGSYAIAPFIRRAWNWQAILAILEALIGLSVLASILVMAHAYDLLDPWLNRLAPSLESSNLGLLLVVAVLAMGPATLLLGVAFPVGVHLYTLDAADRPAVTARLGRFYAVNLAGGIAGAVLAGFILLPWLGSQRSLVLLALLNLSAGLLLLRRPARLDVRRAAPVAALAGLAAVGLIWPAPDLLYTILSGRYRDEQVIFHEEGLQTSVSVHFQPGVGNILFLDGSHQANELPASVQLHQMIGLLPGLLHPDPHSALVIGLGGGATPGALSRYSGVQVDVVELAPAVLHGAAFFRAVNYDVLNAPNVRIRVDDGRNYLLLTRQRYDLITADIVRPWQAGAGNLYAVEYYRLARAALAEDGLMCQWIDADTEVEYKLLMRTFLDAFPYVSLWYDGKLMIGSNSPHALDPASVARKLAAPDSRAALAAVGMTKPEDALGWYVASRDRLLAYVGEGPVISDDRPFVEYFRSLPKSDPPSLDGLRGADPSEIMRR